MSSSCLNQLTGQIANPNAVCSLTSDTRLGYVVGCSRVKGVYVETDVLLGRLVEGLGYKLQKIHRFRKRHSDRDLHESTVYFARTSGA